MDTHISAADVLVIAPYLEALWQYLSEEAKVRKALGISYLSYDWTGLPGWFLWLENMPGTYQIKLWGHEISDLGFSSTHALIRYYPDTNESFFDKYSKEEQRIRNTDFFDSRPIKTIKNDGDGYEHIDVDPNKTMGIPKPKMREMIHPSLFIAGEMDFVSNNRTIQSVTFRTQSHCRTCNSGGDIIRDIPGFQIIKNLVAPILSAFCLLTSSRPQLNIDSAIGETIYAETDGALVSKQNETVQEYIISMRLTEETGLLNETHAKHLLKEIRQTMEGEING